MISSVPNIKNCFGLDISYDSLKVAQVEQKGKFLNIRGLNCLPIPPNCLSKDGIANIDKIAEVLIQAANTAKPTKITAKSLVSALPESQVFTKILTLPQVKEVDLQKAIQFEISEILPMPLTDVIYDTYVLSKKALAPVEQAEESSPPKETADEKPKETKPPISPPNNQKMQDILVVAAPKKLVESFQALAKKAKLNLIALETKPIATSRSLLKPTEKEGILLLDIGAESSSISILDQNTLHFTGTAATGGNAITRKIAETFELAESDADSRKKTVGLDINNKQEKQILLLTLSPIIDEINRAIRYYHNRIQAQDRITTIRITGGTANLIAINPVISEATGCKVDTGNPLVNINEPPANYTPLIMRPYADAIGCALRPFMEQNGS